MLYNLQAMRALAASMVVLLHMSEILGHLGVSADALMFGAAGVDLFFVISGFVMVHTAMAKPQTPGGFMLNRIVRIVPLYWLVTLGLFAATLLVPALFGSLRVSGVELVKSLLFVPFVRFDGGVLPLVFLGWTLNLEMLFYAIFAVSLVVPVVVPRVVLVTALLALVMLSVTLSGTSDPVLRFLGTPLLLEFAMGMWLAIFHARGATLPTWAGWTCVIVGAVRWSAATA